MKLKQIRDQIFCCLWEEDGSRIIRTNKLFYLNRCLFEMIKNTNTIIKNQKGKNLFLYIYEEMITAAERKEIIRNIEQEANKNSDGGIFAKVYKQKDAKDQQQQTKKQAYIDEIQKQIDEKKRGKRRKDQNKLKKIENMRKGQKKISMIKDFKQKINPHTPQTKLQSQRTLQDQNFINITYDAPYTASQNQNKTSFRNNSQHQYNQPQSQQGVSQMQQQQIFQQASYYDSYQQSNYQYQPIQYRSIMPQIIEQIQQEQYELQQINKFNNIEQEQGIDKLKEEIQKQSWNEELRKLRGEIQMNNEKKNRAFYELYNIKDDLKKQQLLEEAYLRQVKQQIANKKSDYLNNSEKKLISEGDYKKSSRQSRLLSNIEDNLILETFVDQI